MSSEGLPETERRSDEEQGADIRAALASTSPDSNAIADAVAARLTLQRGDGEGDIEQERQRLLLVRKVNNLINDLCGSVTYEKAFACLNLMHTLMNNALEHKHEPKYHSFRASQPRIAHVVLAFPQAPDLLIEAGFRLRTREFQQEWYLPFLLPQQQRSMPSSSLATKSSSSFDVNRLEWTCTLIKERMQEYKEASERAEVQRQREKSIEKGRKAQALAEAREDRERVALRTERERAARRAANQAKEQEAAAAAIATARAEKAEES